MKISPITIKSSLIFIRSYKLGDAPALFRLIDNNRGLLKDYFPMSVEHNTSAMASRRYILERNADRKDGKSLFAGIFTADGKTLIGQIVAKDINWRVPKCEMGYFIDKDFFQQGIGSESVKLFSNYCFETLEMAKITLRIEPKNMASKKLAEKCGFEMIGVAKNDFRSSTGRLMECELWERIK